MSSFFFQAEDGIRDIGVTGVQTCALPIWTVKLKADGLADSYVYVLHSRLSQVMSDAVHDGLLARNPCSRRTSPGVGGQRPYRSEERRVGKECRSRGSPHHLKQKRMIDWLQ